MDDYLKALYMKFKAKPNETLLEHTELVLEELSRLNKVALIDENNLELLKKACTYHDIGKINPFFQKRIESKKRFNSEEEVGHNVLSAYLLDIFITDDLSKKNKYIVKNAILNHHHYVNNYDCLKDKRSLIEKNLVEINVSAIKIDEIEFDKKIKKSIQDKDIERLKKLRNDKIYKNILGFLYKCDYCASAHIPCESKNDFLQKNLDLKGYEWNEMQIFCKEKKEKNLAIVGSTGFGKTEASLLWGGDSKIFYVLPLRTAINAMYDRVVRDFTTEDYKEKVGLLHGETASQYLKNINDENALNEDGSEEYFKYFGMTKNLSLPITITTPDQVFNFVFKYPGYEMKLATLSYSKIIIDEIQAYSPDILAYTIFAIKEIVSMGGKFAIFTATLAPFVYDLLIKSIRDLEDEEIEIISNTFLTDKIRHSIKLEDDYINGEYIKNYINIVKKGREPKRESYLVVMNTVSGAQKIYKELRELLGKTHEINLLHSKFTVGDRLKKEEQILNDGKKIIFENSENRKDVIWIATQVVEASLDIDFDYLFTELSELLSLFQRMGRCYRSRVLEIDRENIVIFTKIKDSILIKRDEKESKGFIDKGLYEISKRALKEKGCGVISESDKKNMIDKYYTTDMLKSSKYTNFLSVYKVNYEYIENIEPERFDHEKVDKKFRNVVSYKAIPESLYINDGCINEEIDILINLIKELKENRKNEKEIADKNKYKIKIIELNNQLNNYTVNVDHRYLFGAEKLTEDIFLIKNRYDELLGLQFEKNKNNIEDVIFW